MDAGTNSSAIPYAKDKAGGARFNRRKWWTVNARADTLSWLGRGTINEQSADEALKMQLRMSRDMLPVGSDKEASDNEIVARNTLHMELGYYTDRGPEYNLNEATRDRLIVHTRQDAAHALLNTITLMKEVRRINRRARITQISVAVLVCIAITFLISSWPR
jgi:hypothetical protein